MSRKDVNAATGTKSFNHLSQYPTSLVFVGGPNAGASRGSVASSTRRTFNQACEADYNLFRECLKAALRAGLLAMAMEGCDAVLLAGVSTGLYAGPHKLRVLADFETIVNELLGERIAHNPFGNAPRSLGECFEDVVWTVLR